MCPTGPILRRPTGLTYEGCTAAALGGGDLEEEPTAAYILSLSGGISLLLGALVAILAVVGLLGLFFVVLVIMGALKLKSNPREQTTKGIVILVCAMVGFGPWNLFGGFLVGSILAIVGGALGLTFQPPSPSTSMPGSPTGYGWGPGYGTLGQGQPPWDPPGSPPAAPRSRRHLAPLRRATRRRGRPPPRDPVSAAVAGRP